MPSRWADGNHRIVAGGHGKQVVAPDPEHEIALAQALIAQCEPSEILPQFQRFSRAESIVDDLMRRVCLPALLRDCGNGAKVGLGIGLRHPETISIGDGVFIGEQTIIRGRVNGHCRIGRMSWIGPRSFFDARDLEIREHVVWGPGAKVLCSEHTGIPVEAPIIRTDLRIAPVPVGEHADIGVNSVLLPGVAIGRGAICRPGHGGHSERARFRQSGRNAGTHRRLAAGCADARPPKRELEVGT